MAWHFEWVGGHPALNFLNTLDERPSASPLERVPDYAALVAFAKKARFLDAETAARLARKARLPAARAAWKQALILRETAYRVILNRAGGKAPSPADVDALNALFSETRRHRLLAIRLNSSAWLWNRPEAPERPLWELATALEELLAEVPAERVHKCRASDCGTVFVDTSKTGRRKWCSMAFCGNVHKVRRFRAR